MAAKKRTAGIAMGPTPSSSPAAASRKELVRAHVAFHVALARADVALADVKLKAAKAYRHGVERGDAHVVNGAAAVLVNAIESLQDISEGADVRAVLAPEVSQGREWTFLGKFLAVLVDAHAAELSERANGAAGIAHFRSAIADDPSPLKMLITIYDEYAKISTALGGRKLRDGTQLEAPPLDDLLRDVFAQPHLGLEKLRKTGPDPQHPVARLVDRVFVSVLPNSPEASALSSSFHRELRVYLRGSRAR